MFKNYLQGIEGIATSFILWSYFSSSSSSWEFWVMKSDTSSMQDLASMRLNDNSEQQLKNLNRYVWTRIKINFCASSYSPEVFCCPVPCDCTGSRTWQILPWKKSRWKFQNVFEPATYIWLLVGGIPDRCGVCHVTHHQCTHENSGWKSGRSAAVNSGSKEYVRRETGWGQTHAKSYKICSCRKRTRCIAWSWLRWNSWTR